MVSYKFYKVTDKGVERTKRNCPRCGEGVFLAEHKDRLSCGKCGYTEFNKSSSGKESKQPEPEQPEPEQPEPEQPESKQPEPEQPEPEQPEQPESE